MTAFGWFAAGAICTIIAIVVAADILDRIIDPEDDGDDAADPSIADRAEWFDAQR
jgi:hypothetical protein